MEILNLSYTTRKNKYVQLTHDNICTIYFKFKEIFFFFSFHAYLCNDRPPIDGQCHIRNDSCHKNWCTRTLCNPLWRIRRYLETMNYSFHFFFGIICGKYNMFEYLKYFWKNSANEFNIILYFIFLLNVICFLIYYYRSFFFFFA